MRQTQVQRSMLWAFSCYRGSSSEVGEITERFIVPKERGQESSAHSLWDAHCILLGSAPPKMLGIMAAVVRKSTGSLLKLPK